MNATDHPEVACPDANLLGRVRVALDYWESRCIEPTSSVTGSGAVGVLEREAALAIGRTVGLGLPCGTIALRLALQASGVEADDKVVVAAYDWPAAAGAAMSLGAIPTAADVILPECSLDPRGVERILDAGVKAVILTHLFGIPGDAAYMRQLCDDAGVVLIEDITQAFGAVLDGRPVGSFGHLAVTSLGPSKPVTGEEAGLLLTDDVALHRVAVRHSQHPTRQLIEGIAEPDSANLATRINPVGAIEALYQLDALEGRLEVWRGELQLVEERIADLVGDRVLVPTDRHRMEPAGPELPVCLADPRVERELTDRGLVAMPPGQQVLKPPRAHWPRFCPHATQVDQNVRRLRLSDAEPPVRRGLLTCRP